MDDIVVIILTLLVAVIGIVSQTKKRKTVNQQPGTANRPQNIWDLLETQMTPEPQKYEPEPDQDDDILDIVPDTPVYEYDTKNEGKSIIKEKAEPAISAEEIKKPKKEKFPLRKAVIYSEILNRKYT
jgi:hypothetical protein